MKAEQQSLFEIEPGPLGPGRRARTTRGHGGLSTRAAAAVRLPRARRAPRADLGRGSAFAPRLGRRDRLVTGYCVRLASRLSGDRGSKPVDSIVDRRRLLSPAMLRLTEWMAEYYLCAWGQVLEAVVPAGVRGQAGTRQTQFVSLPNRRRRPAGELQADRRRNSGSSTTWPAKARPLPIMQVARAAGCTVGADPHLAKEGDRRLRLAPFR